MAPRSQNQPCPRRPRCHHFHDVYRACIVCLRGTLCSSLKGLPHRFLQTGGGLLSPRSIPCAKELPVPERPSLRGAEEQRRARALRRGGGPVEAVWSSGVWAEARNYQERGGGAGEGRPPLCVPWRAERCGQVPQGPAETGHTQRRDQRLRSTREGDREEERWSPCLLPPGPMTGKGALEQRNGGTGGESGASWDQEAADESRDPLRLGAEHPGGKL